MESSRDLYIFKNMVVIMDNLRVFVSIIFEALTDNL